MSNRFKNSITLIFLTSIAGCGGGGGSGNSTDNKVNTENIINISGNAYIEYPLKNSTINIKCSNDVSAVGSTDSGGRYSIDLISPRFPCVIKAEGGYSTLGRANDDVLYSIALKAKDGIVNYITTFSLQTMTPDLEVEYQSPKFIYYNQDYLNQSVINLDYRLSMFGFLTAIQSFSSTDSNLFQKDVAQNFNKSLFYRSKYSDKFISEIKINALSTNLDVSYSQFYQNYFYRISNISSLYDVKGWKIHINPPSNGGVDDLTDSTIVNYIVYPGATSYSVAEPELYNLIVPAIEAHEGGVLDLWFEQTYPSQYASAAVFVNNIGIGKRYVFDKITLYFGWY